MDKQNKYKWSAELIEKFEKALEFSGVNEVRQHVLRLLDNFIKYTLWRSVHRGLSIAEAMNQPIQPTTAALDHLMNELGHPLIYDSRLWMEAVRAFCDYVMENRIEIFSCITTMKLEPYQDDPTQFMRKLTGVNGRFVEEFEEDEEGVETEISIPIFEC